MKNLIHNEPVVSAALIGALAGGLISLLVAFGVPVTGDQVEAILNLVEILAPPIAMGIGALIARAKVTPDGRVVERVENGHVLAGEANELPTNTHVREIGDLGVRSSGNTHRADI